MLVFLEYEHKRLIAFNQKKERKILNKYFLFPDVLKKFKGGKNYGLCFLGDYSQYFKTIIADGYAKNVRLMIKAGVKEMKWEGISKEKTVTAFIELGAVLVIGAGIILCTAIDWVLEEADNENIEIDERL